MADKRPPSTPTSDRARRINSLHSRVDSMIQDQDKKRLEISSEISSLTKEQQRLMRQLDMERSEFTHETAAAYNGVVKNLSHTIKQLSIGVKNITMDTAKATSSAIGQYGKAIGEDISINKQNTMVMALAKATPLFGYFAAKFMETDVFQSAAAKMKEKATEGLSAAGESIGNIFKKHKKQSEDMGAALPPKLQEGGFIKKGGMVEVHAAEVVTPVDKILDRIDPAGGEKVISKLSDIQRTLTKSNEEESKTLKAQLNSTNELKAAMIGSADRIQVGWQKTILENPAFRAMTTFGQLMDSVVKAPFKAIFGLRGGFAGDVKRATRTSNIYQQQVNLLALIYTKGMTFLRDISKYTKVSAEALVGEEVSPTSSKTYTLFGRIKEFMTTRKISTSGGGIFDNFVKDLNLDKGALKEAGINSFTDLLSPGMIMRNMGFTKENILGKARDEGRGELFDKVSGSASEKYAIAQAKYLEQKAKFDKTRAGKKASEMYGAGKDRFGKVSSYAAEKGRLLKEGAGGWIGSMKEMGAKAYQDTKTFPGRVVDALDRIRKAEEDREIREGPHSPSMAENIAATAISTVKNNKMVKALVKGLKTIKASIIKTAKETKERYKKEYKDSFERQKELAEIRKASKKTASTTEKAADAAKKTRKDVKGWIPFIFSIFSGIGTKLLGIGKNIAKIASIFLGPFFSIFKLGMKGMLGIGKLFGKGTGGIIKGMGGAAGKALGGARGALAGGGIRGLGQFAMSGGLRAAGAAAGAVGGLAVGGGMALWDMARAIISGDEMGFVGGFITRGLAGFLGGTDTGVSGMAKGAVKGAALGAAIGSIVPGFGTLIGAGIGGAAGAILGFIGGAQLSDAISRTMDGIGDIISVIWKIVKFPINILKEVGKMVWSALSFIGSNIFNSLDDILSDIPIVKDVWSGLKTITRGIIDAFKNLFTTIVSGIKDFFSGGESGDIAKDVMTNILFPIPALVAGFKRIGTRIDEWLSGQDNFIGSTYRWAKRFVGDVNTGNLSASFDKALATSSGNVALVNAQNRKDADLQKMAAKDADALRNQATIAEKVAAAVARNADKNTALRNQATANSTTVISSSVSSNNVNNTSNPWGSVGTPYQTAAQNTADLLAMGNI